MWIDTTKLPDIDQRAEPLELIGQVFGTAGTAPYIHLQLEMSRRLFGDSMPTLIANDGEDENADQVRKIAEQYGAEFISWPRCGHAPGDIRIFRESMKWAERKGLQVIAKFSRRFIPLVSWRHGLQYLMASNTDAAFFTRRHLDSPGGLFRTDAIAYRLRCINNPRVIDSFEETYQSKIRVNVEGMMDAFQKVCGGWAMWDLLGPNFYKPWNKAMQWRGLLPYHYGDLARALDLPYQDIHFLEASACQVQLTGDEPCPTTGSQEMRVVQLDASKPFDAYAISGAVPVDAPPAA